jgi:hypothetical protein
MSEKQWMIVLAGAALLAAYIANKKAVQAQASATQAAITAIGSIN